MYSDQRGVLYPFNPVYEFNPGETRMVSKLELERQKSRELSGEDETRLGPRDRVDFVISYVIYFVNIVIVFVIYFIIYNL